MKIGFFEVREGEKTYLSYALKDHELYFYDFAVDSQNLPKEILDSNIISTHAKSNIDAELIEKLPQLKLIATRTTGFDHIDVHKASELDIPVCNIPAYGENTVAEYAFALILTLTRKMYQSVSQTKAYNFSTNIDLRGWDLFGKKLGVIGTGKIGKHSISIALGFGMKVVAYDAYPNRELQKHLGFEYMGLGHLLSQSDIITLHVPNHPSTFHMINTETIKYIKKGAVLINTSRGEVIETEALIKALDDNIVSAAGLDVLEEEKLNTDDNKLTREQKKLINQNLDLLNRKNVIITPHNGFNTQEAMDRIVRTTVENIQHFLLHNLQNTVNRK